MTKKELIEQLSKYPDNYKVMVENDKELIESSHTDVDETNHLIAIFT